MITETRMKSVTVLGSQVAYVDTGTGVPVLLLHGNPTSSYLWRNVIPHIAKYARCIAPDLIGMGQSDKPQIGYRVADHARYLQAFIEALELDRVVLVLHDWGSALGLDWARRNEKRVRGIVLMEFITPVPTWQDMDQGAADLFKSFRDPITGRRLLIDENAFIEVVLPRSIVRALSNEEMDAYRRPFLDPAAREPVYQFPNELPIAGEPAATYAMATAYHAWLLETEIPKLFFWADPGALVSPARAVWYEKRLKVCRTIALGAGLHFVQEDHPDRIGSEIAAWLPTIV
jgi:haloalkane dehalogenase